MMNRKVVIKLFEDCIPVKGWTRSIIHDLTRNKYYFIPNDLHEILSEIDGKTFDNLLSEYGEENKDIINSYISFLEKNELIFYTDENLLNNFPKISRDWDFPGTISNAIIDFKQYSTHNIPKIINELDSLGCYAVQIRFFCKADIKQIKDTVKCFDNSDIKQVDIIIEYSTEMTQEALLLLFKSYHRINSIFIYNAPQNIADRIEADGFERIVFLSEKNISERNCGIVDKFSFFTNVQLFLESVNYNNCLNRKISVDPDGYIKNCPSMTHEYGNVNNTTLSTALSSKDFKRLWSINKDEIEICKDCEFRYMCIDCRAYVANPQNINSAPLKCGYDPYTGIWDKWFENPLKKAAIDFYDLSESL